MAAIDKIYGTTEQYDELKNWLADHATWAMKYLYPRDGYINNDRPISNFPVNIDIWLLKKCKIDWVINKIKEQYGKI